MPDTISSTGYWQSEAPRHIFDEMLCAEIAKLLKEQGANDVLDLGCGNGSYVASLRGAGIPCRGIDGNPNTPAITLGECTVADLTDKNLDATCDWSLCLEVGEHIPKEFQGTLTHNISKAWKGAIISWAVPGQGGWGHVNCQTNDFIIEMMKLHGFIHLPEESTRLRESARVVWFKNTLMVFKNNKPDNGKWRR